MSPESSRRTPRWVRLPVALATVVLTVAGCTAIASEPNRPASPSSATTPALQPSDSENPASPEGGSANTTSPDATVTPTATASSTATNPTPSPSPTPTSPTPSESPSTPTPLPTRDLPTGVDPARIEIPAIRVDAAIVDLALGPGDPEVPEAWEDAGWYTTTRNPGEYGPAVIAGHIDSKSGPAVFFRLDELRPGDQIIIHGEDGATRTFTVHDTGQYPKTDLPAQVFAFGAARPELRLITCSGSFDTGTGHYRDNLVIYAAHDTPSSTRTD